MTLSLKLKKPMLPAFSRVCLLALRAAAILSLLLLPLAFDPRQRAAYWLKIAQCAAIFALSFLPRLLHMEQMASAAFFALFLLLAGLFGSVFEGYAALPHLDVLAHFLSGALCVLLLAQLCRRSGIIFTKKRHFVFAALLFTAACAGLWEMYEFTVFGVLKNTALSRELILGELGLRPAAIGAACLDISTVQSFLHDAYDSFCDTLCALVGAAAAAVAKILIYHKATN